MIDVLEYSQGILFIWEWSEPERPIYPNDINWDELDQIQNPEQEDERS